MRTRLCFAVGALSASMLGAGCASVSPGDAAPASDAAVASSANVVCVRQAALGSRIKREECGKPMTEEERTREREAAQDAVRGQQVYNSRVLGATYGD